MKIFGLAIGGLLLAACGLATTRPKLEMVMAQTAYMAARQANAQGLAPEFFRRAEFYYLKAKTTYRQKFFNKAKQYALLSRQFAERAEFIAVRKKALDNLQ